MSNQNACSSNLSLDAKVFIPGKTISISSKLDGEAKPFVPIHPIKVSVNVKIWNQRDSFVTCSDAAPYSEPTPNILSRPVDTDCSTNNETDSQLGNEERDVYTRLKDIRIKNLDRILIGSLNINSIRNKFHMLSDIVAGKIDILLISESKLDNSFPNSNFKLPGFSTPFRRDRTCFGGGILIYFREDIPSTLLSSIQIPDHVECLIIEVRLKKVKWLLINLYNPSKGQIGSQLAFLSKAIDHYAIHYDNILILGDFNIEMSEKPMIDFCAQYNLKNLVKEPTCYKNSDNPTCIDLMLTNRHRSFMSTCTVETGLSDFHKMTITALKTKFKKNPPKVVSYRDFKHFSDDHFSLDLKSTLRFYDMNNISFEVLDDNIMKLVNKHAPIKYKYVRANHGAFMTKELRKAIMTRSKLKNIYNRNKTVDAKSDYNKQRNFCTNLLRKTKLSYFQRLNPSSITDNKLFWKTVKPVFSDKVKSQDAITIIDEGNIISDDNEVAITFKNFFANAVKELNINRNLHCLAPIDNEVDPIINACIKFQNHPSILKIKEINTPTPPFNFNFISIDNMANEITSIKNSKAIPIDSLPVRILKSNPYL